MTDDRYVLIDIDADIWFGFPGSELTYHQKRKSINFDKCLSQWLLDNVGKFGKEWWTDIDKEHDSMQALFRDPDVETWVRLKWCDNGDEE